MNPNSLVPTLEEEDGYTLWESNSIVRYLAAKHQSRVLEPADLRIRANAHKWMDWQLSVVAPAIHGLFWGLIRTPPEKRDHADIANSKERTTKAMAMLDGQLAKTKYVASDEFSYGDIPVGVMTYRFVQSRARSPADAQSRSLVRGDLIAPGLQGPRRRRAADVKRRKTTAPRRAAVSAPRRSAPPPRG